LTERPKIKICINLSVAQIDYIKILRKHSVLQCIYSCYAKRKKEIKKQMQFEVALYNHTNGLRSVNRLTRGAPWSECTLLTFACQLFTNLVIWQVRLCQCVLLLINIILLLCCIWFDVGCCILLYILDCLLFYLFCVILFYSLAFRTHVLSCVRGEIVILNLFYFILKYDTYPS
jgi:hypothetical protein